MTSNLKGKTQLQQRFVAVADKVLPQTAERWQRNATKKAKQTVGSFDMPYSKGDLVSSIRAGRIQTRGGSVARATITMEYHGYFVDAGTQGHGTHSRMSRVIARRGISGDQYAALIGTSRAKFARQARSRRGGGYAARPFREQAAKEAMQPATMKDILTDVWNGAA
jgi:hypothetical protein